MKKNANPRESGRILPAVLTLFVSATIGTSAQTSRPQNPPAIHASAQSPQPPDPQEERPAPQDSPEPLGNAKRLFRAMFAGANTGQERETSLSFSGSAFEVFDQDEVDVGEPQLGGLYTSVTGDLDYARSASRAQIATTGGANFRYYSRLSRFFLADYHGRVGVDARLTGRTTMFVTETLEYSPVALPSLFANPVPAELDDPLADQSRLAVTSEKFITSATTVSATHGFSVRSQLIASGSFRYSNFLGGPSASDWSTLDSELTYRHRVGNGESLRLGYTNRRARYSLPQAPGGRGPQPSEHHTFFGAALERAYSNRSRTLVTVEAGTSLFSDAFSELRNVDNFRFVFDAALAQQFGRTWLLLASFDRGGQFNQGYGGPVFADSVFLSATGFFSDRTDFTASLAHTEGASVLTVAGPPFTTMTAGIRVRRALSRQWALSAEYLRYSYDFKDAAGLTTLIGVPNLFKRNSLRAGISMFLPITAR